MGIKPKICFFRNGNQPMADNDCHKVLKARIAELEQEAHKRKAAEKKLQDRLGFESLVSTISSKFKNLELDHIDAGIEDALRRIGEFVQADQNFIFRFSSDGGRLDNTHRWSGPRIKSNIKKRQSISLKWSPWLITQINAAQVVDVFDVDQLPLEADAVKELCRLENIKSLLLVPTEYAGMVIGFMGLAAVGAPNKWASDVISLLRIVGEIFANASERKRTEEALRHSEEKYRTILEAVDESYWEVNLKGDFLFFSPSLSKLLGYTPAELMDMNYRKYVSPGVARRMYRIFNSIYKTGKSVKVTDFEHITKDRSNIVVEMSISLMRNCENQPIGFRGVSRDVTHRRQAEQALLESEQRYRTVLEANPDPVAVYDISDRVVYFNPAFSKVFGWDLDELAGKKMKGFVPEQSSSETELMAKQVMAGKSFSGIETHRFTKNGDFVPVSISGAVYKDVNGKPVGSVITIRDIRDKKKLETQLLNVHKMESLGTLAGGIAHDFNNLLMSIQGNLSLILFDLKQNHPHFELLENIEKNVESGSKLTAQLLGFSKKGKYELKPIHLNQMVKNVTQTIGRARKEIVIYCDLADDLAAVEADDGQIEQVLLNLMVNAGQAMPTGGEIRLKTRNVGYEEIIGSLYQPEPGNYVMLTVTDTGTGMDKEVLDHIFEPFFTTKEPGRGTGLGLASVYSIIKGHNGYIDVDSEVGRGTTFFVYLPVTNKSFPKSIEIADQATASGSETILLVDDEEMVLDVSAKMLSVVGYNVLTACNGKDALDIFIEKHGDIDLVLLDVIMPNMSGSTVFDRMKEINPSVKVLLLSGYSANGQVEQILLRGCNGFIQKPFNVKTISARIREILG